ncbi:MAG: putative RNA uridine N3 methyltransferase [Thermofilaceae archaeon]
MGEMDYLKEMKVQTRIPPPRPRIKRRVIIPSTIFLGEDGRLSTFRIGFIARYLTIFRVEEVLVFGPPTPVSEVLKYAETPQYLRRRAIPKGFSLRFVGVIPPLQSPHHPPSFSGKGFICEFREGIVLSTADEWLYVDIGFSEPVKVLGKAKIGERVTVILTNPMKIVDKCSVPYYWGYTVINTANLYAAVEMCKDYVKIATSRLGEPVSDIASKLVVDASAKRGIAVFFGTRDKGLFELATEEKLKIDECFDYVVNLIPRQGVFTIRTEEALPVTLAVLDYILNALEK